jgi:hypothetical protein
VTYRVRIRREAPPIQRLQRNSAVAVPIPKKPGRFPAGTVRTGEAGGTGPSPCHHADRDPEPRPGRA